MSKYEEWKQLGVSGQIRYFVYQIEVCPKTNKDHIQGYLELKKQFRLTGLKKLLGSKTVHIEARKGTQKQAIDYCSKSGKAGGRKKGTKQVILGAPGAAGTRTDLAAVAAMIKDGNSELDLFNEHPTAYLKYSGHIKRAIELQRRPLRNTWRDVTLTCLWGDCGAGKTRWVLDHYGPENVYVVKWNGQKFWFDGYEGQKVLLLNEFYGQARTSLMQDLFDKYCQQFEIKCGHTISCWDHVYVTSNVHPRQWWNSYENVPMSVQKSFIRRFTNIVHMPAPPELQNLQWEDKEISFEEFVAGSSITPATSETLEVPQDVPERPPPEPKVPETPEPPEPDFEPSETPPKTAARRRRKSKKSKSPPQCGVAYDFNAWRKCAPVMIARKNVVHEKLSVRRSEKSAKSEIKSSFSSFFEFSK